MSEIVEENGKPVMLDHGGILRREIHWKQFTNPLWVSATLEFEDGFVPALRALDRADEPKENELPYDWRIVQDALNFFRTHIYDLFRNVVYIPPIRDVAKRYYSTETSWVRGLQENADNAVTEIVNPWLASSNLHAELQAKTLSTQEGISAVYLKEKSLNGDIEVNLRYVGSGVAQALPIIVAGVQANVGSLLIIEQPELHLHPEAQVALADMFVNWQNQGMMLLIETHSEHLLLHLRKCVAEATLHRLQDTDASRNSFSDGLQSADVVVLFIDRNISQSVVQTMWIDNYGDIGNPSDEFSVFFDSAYKDIKSLAITSAQIRQLESGNVRHS